MLAIVNSCAVYGMDGFMVRVEVDVSSGLPGFDIVGLPDAAVKESKERVRAALRNCGFDFPMRRITVNLAPADIKKAGAAFDLPIAVGILAATDQIKAPEALARGAFVGELSLEGLLRPIYGSLVMGDCIKKAGLQQFYLPGENAAEAALTDGIEVYGPLSLSALTAHFASERPLTPVTANAVDLFAAGAGVGEPDMAEVKGQYSAKRALEIAAAGGHNVFLVGPPGSGKTMLAKRFSSILPPLTFEESLEITKIYSVAGMLPQGVSLLTKRPFRSPHHNASAAAVIGGGAHPKPGEVSLATHGILFMDELSEFSRDVLEALRQPLEDGVVNIARVGGRITYPARFQLLGAFNPCPCGYLGDPFKTCTCTDYAIKKYIGRLSGPLWDRVDIHISVPRVAFKELAVEEKSESSAAIRQRVSAARQLSRLRLQGSGITCNAAMGRKQIQQFCRLDASAQGLLAEAFTRLHLSARSHDKVLKLARTIADLAAAEQISLDHLAEALQYRNLDRE